MARTTENIVKIVPGYKSYSFIFNYGEEFERYFHNDTMTKLVNVQISPFPPNYLGTIKAVEPSRKATNSEHPDSFDFVHIDEIEWVEIHLKPIPNGLSKDYKQESIIVIFDFKTTE